LRRLANFSAYNLASPATSGGVFLGLPLASRIVEGCEFHIIIWYSEAPLFHEHTFLIGTDLMVFTDFKLASITHWLPRAARLETFGSKKKKKFFCPASYVLIIDMAM